MTKRLQNITNNIYPYILISALLVIWYLVCLFEIVPQFMLPSPQSVINALISDRNELFKNAVVTLTEAFIGLSLSIIFSGILSMLMEEQDIIYKMFYPIIIITQTIPTIAIAPLLILWLGFGILPKVVLIFVTCFFPLTISILGGLRSADRDTIRLLKSMGATKLHILWWVKIPYATEGFFSGLKVSASYAIVGAVIAEWLGGNAGLGVYMTRVRKSYSFDKMFAVIFLISIISLVILWLVDKLYKKSIKWKTEDVGEKND